MANQSEDRLLPQTVAKAFVLQYYHVESQHIHKFYTEESVLSRPHPNGDKNAPLTTVQGMMSIQQMLSSFVDEQYGVEIETVDSQFSLNDGVIVLVTGYLTSNVRRKFTQTFFLAPQANSSYFVLNDIFNYVDYVESTPSAHLAPNHVVVTEPSDIDDQHVLSPTTSVEINNTNGIEVNNIDEKEANNVLDNAQESVTEKSVVADTPVESREHVAPQVLEPAASSPQMDAPKKSFASLAKALSVSNAPFTVRAPTPKPVERPRAPVKQEASSRNNSAVEKNNVPAVKSYAIFVPNLPMNATVVELENIFKKFGSIKPKGVQVRSYQQQGNCFGFVDFESESSMQNALKASPIQYVDGRELSIAERRANNDRGRFSSGRGGYQNDNFRSRGENFVRENYTGGRGNYGGGRGYARNDSDKGEYREFSGQGRGYSGRNGDAAHQNQKPYQNGGKGSRQPAKAVAEQNAKAVAEQPAKVVT